MSEKQPEQPETITQFSPEEARETVERDVLPSMEVQWRDTGWVKWLELSLQMCHAHKIPPPQWLVEATSHAMRDRSVDQNKLGERLNKHSLRVRRVLELRWRDGHSAEKAFAIVASEEGVSEEAVRKSWQPEAKFWKEFIPPVKR